MDRKYDIEPGDDDDLDFESTHSQLRAYRSERRPPSEVELRRQVWEQKVMRNISELRARVAELEDGQHDTQEIRVIANRAVAPYTGMLQAWQFVITWRNRIVSKVVLTGVGIVVAWWLTKRLGITVPGL